MLLFQLALKKKTQLLSASLQNGIRFLQCPLPATPSFGLATALPLRECFGLTEFPLNHYRWLSLRLYPGGVFDCVVMSNEPDDHTP